MLTPIIIHTIKTFLERRTKVEWRTTRRSIYDKFVLKCSKNESKRMTLFYIIAVKYKNKKSIIYLIVFKDLN